MKRPIAISLSPNSSHEDVRLAWQLLFVHWYWKDKKILSRAAEKIAQRFPGHFVSLASSGRQALFDVLRSYSIGKGDEVIIQAFTCIAVPESIVWTGATPVYADLPQSGHLSSPYSFDPEDVRKKITPKTKAIILQHTFGIPGPIREIVAIAKEYNLLVIEDCAHALGAVHDGKMVGTFGDSAIFSFGRDKSISTIFGGVAITKNKNHNQKLLDFQASRKLPPRLWVAQQLFHIIFFHYVLPLYFWHHMGKVILVVFQRLHLLSRAVAHEEKSGKRPSHIEYSYSPALALLLIGQLERLDGFTRRRQEIAARYVRELHVAIPYVIPRVDIPSWLRFPVLMENARGVFLDAREQDMLLGDWYDAPLVPASADYNAFMYEKGSCPNAEEAAKRIINLPTYPSLDDTQVTSVIAFINSYGNKGN